MLYQSNNKKMTNILRMVEDILKNEKENSLSEIYQLYLLMKDNNGNLSEKNRGKFLGLKMFFEASNLDTGTFQTHEVMSKTCEKEMLKMIKYLYIYKQTYPDVITYSENELKTHETELEKKLFEYTQGILSLIDTKDDLKNLFKLKPSRVSSELKFVLNMFYSINSIVQKRQCIGALEQNNQLLFPYYYLAQEYVDGYQKLPIEYREILRRLYEQRLQQKLGISNIHVDIFISKKHTLMCVITKQNKKDKKNKCLQIK